MGVSEARIRMIERAAMFCGDHVVAFFPKALGQSPVKSGGTGALVAIGEERFLFTASHVLNRYRREGSNWLPFIDAGFGGEQAIVLEGCRAIGLDDEHDIAVVRLTPEVVTHLSRKSFLLLSLIDPSDEVDSRESEYLVLGFPTALRTNFDRSAGEMTATFFIFGTVPHVGKTSHLVGFDQKKHFAVVYSQDDVWDQDNKPASLPDPDGLSGSVIWRMRGRGEPAEEFSEKWIRCVGVEHSKYEKARLLKGSKIRYAMKLVYQEFPKLRGEVDRAFEGMSLQE